MVVNRDVRLRSESDSFSRRSGEAAEQARRGSSPRLSSQEDLAKLFGDLFHDRADKLDIGMEEFFFHQLGEALFDAFAGADPAECRDRGLAFFR